MKTISPSDALSCCSRRRPRLCIAAFQDFWHGVGRAGLQAVAGGCNRRNGASSGSLLEHACRDPSTAAIREHAPRPCPLLHWESASRHTLRHGHAARAAVFIRRHQAGI